MKTLKGLHDSKTNQTRVRAVSISQHGSGYVVKFMLDIGGGKRRNYRCAGFDHHPRFLFDQSMGYD